MRACELASLSKTIGVHCPLYMCTRTDARNKCNLRCLPDRLKGLGRQRVLAGYSRNTTQALLSHLVNKGWEKSSSKLWHGVWVQ